MRILLIEDDIILSEIIEEYVQKLNHDVICSFDGYKAESLCFDEKFDLLLIDVNIPNLNGFELLLNLRKNSINTPAIFITSLNTSKDLEQGFKSGGDDYIKKPFDLSELNVRINNIKRLYKIEDTSVINIKENMLFDMQNYKITIGDGDKVINLSKKESKILEYLINNNTKPTSTNELGINIWGYSDAPTNATIRTYIKNIRKHIGASCIETIKGIGYKFNNNSTS